MDFIGVLEKELGMKAEKNMMPIQPGDVPETSADIEKTKKLLGFSPKTPVEVGIRNFVAWYREYFGI
jgi:UDP-glucuronate 4-epimerase